MKNKNFIRLFIITAFVFLSGCETVDLNQTENPSTLNASFLDPYYTFNYVQINLPDFVYSTNNFTQQVTRQMAMTGGNMYDSAFEPASFNSNWSTAFNILNAIKIMEPVATSRHQQYILGASKIIRCYVLMTLVDMYGDIPYSQSLQGIDNLTPVYDSSASVYKGILIELDDAIQTLKITDNLEPSMPKDADLYYSDKASWITLAKTLKLKMYNNARLAGSDIGISDVGAAIASIVSAGDYIDTPSKDFAFKYGNSRNTPNARHPLYNDQYELGGGAYIGNYFMWAMSKEKNYSSVFGYVPPAGSTDDKFPDPRLHFYFYKQNTDPSKADNFTLPGRNRPSWYNDYQYTSFYDHSIGTPYSISNWVSGSSVPSTGFWGRDHGDNGGIPPDSDKRTVCGLYPIGGAYGANTKSASVQNSGVDGLKGAGIMPIMLSSYVHFIIAEAALTVPSGSLDATRARIEYEAGISNSIQKVTTFGSGQDGFPTDIDNVQLNINKTKYLSTMMSKYDSFTGNDRLEVVIKEYYLAAWGNGIEPYNNYRRTGFPSNFQPTVLTAAGTYYSTAYYSGNAVNNNPNVPTNVRTRKVFWDKANVVLH
jgi:hypothetical protein